MPGVLLAQSRFLAILSLTFPRPVSSTASRESSSAYFRVASRIASMARPRPSSGTSLQRSKDCTAARIAASRSSKTPSRAPFIEARAGAARARIGPSPAGPAGWATGAWGTSRSSGESWRTTRSTIALIWPSLRINQPSLASPLLGGTRTPRLSPLRRARRRRIVALVVDLGGVIAEDNQNAALSIARRAHALAHLIHQRLGASGYRVLGADLPNRHAFDHSFTYLSFPATSISSTIAMIVASTGRSLVTLVCRAEEPDA